MSTKSMQRTMRIRTLFAAAFVAAAAAVAGCGGNTVTGPTINATTTPTPVPTGTPAPTSTSGTLSTNSASSTSLTLGPIGPNGNTGTVVAPASSSGSTFTVVFSLTLPANIPAPSAARRLPKDIGGANLVPIAYFQITTNPGTTLPSWPGFSFTFGSSQTLPDPTHSYVAEFDPSNPSAGWTTIEGPASASGGLFTWTAAPNPVTLNAGNPYTFVLFSTTSALSTPSPSPSPSPSPTASPTPTPAPGSLDLSTSSMSFTATGAANAQQLTVSETNYSGPFTVTTGPTSSCSGIVSVSPSSGTGPSQVFTITPAAPGNCTLVVNDNGNNAPQSVGITVTTTTGTISAKPGTH